VVGGKTSASERGIWGEMVYILKNPAYNGNTLTCGSPEEIGKGRIYG
jgi:hypothetical protein